MNGLKMCFVFIRSIKITLSSNFRKRFIAEAYLTLFLQMILRVVVF